MPRSQKGFPLLECWREACQYKTDSSKQVLRLGRRTGLQTVLLVLGSNKTIHCRAIPSSIRYLGRGGIQKGLQTPPIESLLECLGPGVRSRLARTCLTTPWIDRPRIDRPLFNPLANPTHLLCRELPIGRHLEILVQVRHRSIQQALFGATGLDRTTGVPAKFPAIRSIQS